MNNCYNSILKFISFIAEFDDNYFVERSQKKKTQNKRNDSKYWQLPDLKVK